MLKNFNNNKKVKLYLVVFYNNFNNCLEKINYIFTY